jgi:hypothetical protein
MRPDEGSSKSREQLLAGTLVTTKFYWIQVLIFLLSSHPLFLIVNELYVFPFDFASHFHVSTKTLSTSMRNFQDLG